jgi:penicillin G amidase
MMAQCAAMRRAFGSRILAGLLIAFTAGCAEPAPPLRGTPIEGPRHAISIVTDRWGIPHVRAESLEDLYYAWGWVTARDRLWQISYARQAGRGELWRWFGNTKLRDDGGAQLLEFGAMADRIWRRERGDSTVRIPIERFTDGVNAWLAACRSGERAWPEEFRRIGHTPDDWEPADSIVLLLGMGLMLDFAVPELTEEETVNQRGEEWLAARRRWDLEFAYHTIPPGAEAMNVKAAAAVESKSARGSAPAIARHADREDLLPSARATLGRWLIEREPGEHASDLFAIGPRRSASGRPMLANDLHLSMTNPAQLYVIHVEVPGVLRAAGACVPGLPAIVTGRSDRCAWGVTSLAADVVDVWADTLSADGKSVRSNGEWVPIREVPFQMSYRLPGGILIPPLGQVRRYTPHGPVLVYAKDRGIAYSCGWARNDSMVTLNRLLGLERSRDANEVAERWRSLVTPGLNVVAADVDGNVVYQAVGQLPRREFDPGFGPLPNDGEHEWSGLLSSEDLPSWSVPGDGHVVSANNLPASGLDPNTWTRFDWPQDRGLRLNQLLSAKRTHTLDDLARIQNDVYSLPATRMVPRLLRAADSFSNSIDARARAAIDTLRAWNFEARRGLVGPTIHRSWFAALSRRHELDGRQGLTLAALDGRAPDALGDESSADAVHAALDTAMVRLEGLFGPDLSTWTWERGHRARFRHTLSSDTARAFEPDPLAADGDNGTPSVGASRLPWSTEFNHAPVVRHLVDLAVAESSFVVLPPGNSGDPTSPHARDHLQLWADHRYVPLLMDWSRIAVERESEDTLRARPR